jgi:hypothetical protein
MDPGCPLVDHVYNLIAHEYQQAEQGHANSDRILLLETLLRRMVPAPEFPLSIKGRLKDRIEPTRDRALQLLAEKIRANEVDPALTFENKTAVKRKLQTERRQILQTKSRVHRFSVMPARLRMKAAELLALGGGFRSYPLEKSKGFLYRYTVGLFLWFLGVIRGNIGYSVALAIYGPFTFYFITQPMNPHAMWAVGKVRQAYLQTVAQLRTTPGFSFFMDAPATALKTGEGTAGPTDTGSLEVPYASVVPKHEGMLLATDVPEVDQQKWHDRMSNFKAMQIAYEGSMEFAARMGRLEQMETQLNFPLIGEHAYRELETYQSRLEALKRTLSKSPTFPKIAQYFDQEEARARQYKLYIWDKLVRYMYDHPYIVMNEGDDQAYVDYYMGRGFIFLEEITRELIQQYQGFEKPKSFKKVEELSKLYREKEVRAPTLFERLKKNSIIHAQKNLYDSEEMRTYMKRQWEVLFLLQNRAQEAANFGLQMYTWSVRNAIWVLGALHTAKTREVDHLQELLRQGEKAGALKVSDHELKNSESLVESLYHILATEYVSIRKELVQSLDQDVEGAQRQLILDQLQKSFQERASFYEALTGSPR